MQPLSPIRRDTPGSLPPSLPPAPKRDGGHNGYGAPRSAKGAVNMDALPPRMAKRPQRAESNGPDYSEKPSPRYTSRARGLSTMCAGVPSRITSP